MREVEPSEKEQIFERLRYYALAAVEMDAEVKSIKLNFVSTTDGEEDLRIEFFEPLLIKLSRTPDDDGPYLIGDLTLEALSLDEEKKLMERLGYYFRDPDTNNPPSFGRQLFHFFLEGAICIDIVFEDYSIKAGLPIPMRGPAGLASIR